MNPGGGRARSEGKLLPDEKEPCEGKDYGNGKMASRIDAQLLMM